MDKLGFNGTILSIQPRIRMIRSFDESSHAYLGYAIKLEGWIDPEKDLDSNTAESIIYSIGIGKAAQAKNQFKVNDIISGQCLPVEDPEKEPVQYYKVSKLKLRSEGTLNITSPPWKLIPPKLETYRERGRRRLAARTFDTKCNGCMWGCRMPVEIIVDNWNPRETKKYRYETFCYGPLDCKLYKAGANRKVEGRNGIVYIEEDWVDEMNIEHRNTPSS